MSLIRRYQTCWEWQSDHFEWILIVTFLKIKDIRVILLRLLPYKQSRTIQTVNWVSGSSSKNLKFWEIIWIIKQNVFILWSSQLKAFSLYGDNSEKEGVACHTLCNQWKFAKLSEILSLPIFNVFSEVFVKFWDKLRNLLKVACG